MLAHAARRQLRDHPVALVVALPLGKLLGLFALHLAFLGVGATMYEAGRVETGCSTSTARVGGSRCSRRSCCCRVRC
jgi:hypothetical protein